MKNQIIILAVLSAILCKYSPGQLSAQKILEKTDANIIADNKYFKSKMIIHSRRGSRTIVSQSWVKGTEKSFTEYLAPARERGIKMLRIGDQLWMYSPRTDRTIRIAGHMLRQSIMGSDLSYEDFMEDPNLSKLYNAAIIKEENYLNRPCWVMDLTAAIEDIAYYKRKLWIDRERFLVLKEELFARSGELLKTSEIRKVFKTGGRWYPKHMVFKDAMKKGKGTEIIIEDIRFNEPVDEYRLSRAFLKR